MSLSVTTFLTKAADAVVEALTAGLTVLLNLSERDEQAVGSVRERANKGGHNVPLEVMERFRQVRATEHEGAASCAFREE